MNLFNIFEDLEILARMEKEKAREAVLMRATAVAPAAEQIDKFRKMLQRAGRGRIRLRVDIHYDQNLATLFEGVFAAALRR